MARPVGAGILTMVGGVFILVGGVTTAVIEGIISGLLGFFSSLGPFGHLLGALTILMGPLMVALPSADTVWGILAIVFAFGSIPLALGGFLAGFILAMAGGVMSIRWRHPPHPPVITLHARTVP